MKSKALALFLSLVFLLSCATSDAAKQVKIYQDNLALLVGKDAEEVTKTIAYSWSFSTFSRSPVRGKNSGSIATSEDNITH